MKDGYFLELGGFNAVTYSTTIQLSNWHGLIVEANEERAKNIGDYSFNSVTVLNFALTNQSGTIVTFYDLDDASSSSVNAIVAKDRVVK